MHAETEENRETRQPTLRTRCQSSAREIKANTEGQMHVKHSKRRTFFVHLLVLLVQFGSRCSGSVAYAKFRHKAAAKYTKYETAVTWAYCTWSPEIGFYQVMGAAITGTTVKHCIYHQSNNYGPNICSKGCIHFTQNM